jgi:predicted transcriptional regulator
MSKIQLPEAELVRRTFIVKEVDLPPHVRMTKRSLLRWFALSSGLISEQESRQTILDVLDALLYFHLSKKQTPSTKEIQHYIKEKTQEEISEKLLRYHLKRLLDLNFLVRDKQTYKFNPAPSADPNDLVASFNYWISQGVHASTKNIENALGDLTKTYL